MASAPTLPNAPVPPPPADPGHPARLGPYRVVRPIGRGGMGVVYLAEDPALGRYVAVKVLPAARTPDARARLLREARALAALDHDHVVPVYQVGEDDGVVYLAMKLLRGETLAARTGRGPRVPAGEALRVGREVAAGLAAAHAAGLVHRDVKPGNIWLSDVRSADCGVRNDDPFGGSDSAPRNPHSAFRIRKGGGGAGSPPGWRSSPSPPR